MMRHWPNGWLKLCSMAEGQRSIQIDANKWRDENPKWTTCEPFFDAPLLKGDKRLQKLGPNKKIVTPQARHSEEIPRSRIEQRVSINREPWWVCSHHEIADRTESVGTVIGIVCIQSLSSHIIRFQFTWGVRSRWQDWRSKVSWIH